MISAIADEVFDDWVERDLDLRMKLGLPIQRLPDVTYAEAQREAEFARSILRRLDDAQPADDEERVTAAHLRWACRRPIEALELFWFRFPVTPYQTPLFSINNAVTRLPDARPLLDQMPRVVDDMLETLREQEHRGIRLPKDEVPTVTEMLTGLAQSLSPAIARLAAHFDDDYLAHAPDGVGIAQYPGGAEAYRTLVRQETNTELTPEEIHELGLREMARIDREMHAVMKEVEFTGSRADFHRYLKSEPRLYAKSPEEIRARLLHHIRRIEPHVQRFFARTPKAPYDVRRDAPEFEGGATFGWYCVPSKSEPAGIYYFNGSKLDERNLLSAAAVAAHEIIPGHHFQLALQLENESLPAIRREAAETAFGEGWGEYASELAAEMGLYDEPYDRAGRLMMDAMISARLVVDTGMNALGWSRARAMAYLRENTMLSETEIATETLRYAVDIPAHALAYKIGSLKMTELRALAQRELGTRFDIRQFHDWILSGGSMPLPLLEQRVRSAIDAALSVA